MNNTIDFSKPFQFKAPQGANPDWIYRAVMVNFDTIEIDWSNHQWSGVTSIKEAEQYIDKGVWQILPTQQEQAMLSLEDYIKAIHNTNADICSDDFCTCFDEDDLEQEVEEFPIVSVQQLREWSAFTGADIIIRNGVFDVFYKGDEPLTIYTQYDLLEAMNAIGTLVSLEDC